MHFLFILLLIKGLYMFRAFLAHPQEAQQRTALGILRAWYASWLHQGWSGTQFHYNPEDGQEMVEAYRGP
jgi:hypothetical protein